MSIPPRPRQKKVRRLRGECLIEGLPTAAGAAIAREGLRLRLDLRLEPDSARATELSPRTEPMPPAGRGFTERIVQRARAVPQTYQRWAVLSGVGTLVVMVALWVFGTPLEQGRDAETGSLSGTAPSASAAETAPIDSSAAGAGTPDSAALAAAPEAVGAPALSPRLAPAPAVVPQAALVSAAHAVAKPSGPPDALRARRAPLAIALARPVVEATPSARPRAAARPAPARDAEADQLELFADTK